MKKLISNVIVMAAIVAGFAFTTEAAPAQKLCPLT